MPVRTRVKVKASVLQANHFCQSSRKIQRASRQTLKLSFLIGLLTGLLLPRRVEGKVDQHGRKMQRTPGSFIVRTPALIKKVARFVKTPNPLFQLNISWKHGIAKRTASAILKIDLGLNWTSLPAIFPLSGHPCKLGTNDTAKFFQVCFSFCRTLRIPHFTGNPALVYFTLTCKSRPGKNSTHPASRRPYTGYGILRNFTSPAKIRDKSAVDETHFPMNYMCD